jgi:hypothetical protein
MQHRQPVPLMQFTRRRACRGSAFLARSAESTGAEPCRRRWWAGAGPTGLALIKRALYAELPALRQKMTTKTELRNPQCRYTTNTVITELR